MSHVALCCWIRETRGRNSQTDTRLSRLNKHAGNKNLIRSQKKKTVFWKWHRRNPIFPFSTGPKGATGRERQNSACHFRVKREGLIVWRAEGWGSLFLIFKVICLLLACPCGVFDLGLAFKSIWEPKWINTRHSAFSLACKLQKVTNLKNNDTYTYILELVIIT